MAVDYAEREREFLAGLEADTGHDLAGWMTLIEAQNLAHRNDIIDWLRTKGFHFSWASWLERIHHNGGRPIYAGAIGAPAGAAQSLPAARAAPASAGGTRPTVAVVPSVGPASRDAGPVTRAADRPQWTASPSGADLPALLAAGKAYRMLAEHLIREVQKAIPEVSVTARDGYVSFGRPVEFAALAISPKELRFGLELGEDAVQSVVPRGRMSGTAATITHVGVLTDARQVNAPLIEAVKQAHRKVNPG
jgi:hypothetical protein